jgi:FkbM family methyltransferase
VIRKIINKLANRPPEPPTLKEYNLHLVNEVISTVCKPDTVCVEVGAGEGDILQLFIEKCPEAIHYAFEPNPHLYFAIKRKFASAAQIYKLAISNTNGTGTFYNVVSQPSYSGLKQTILHRDEQVEKSPIKIVSLDEYIQQREKIGVLKIQASGAEYQVLKGASNLINTCKPTILFSSSHAISQSYDVNAEKMHEFFQQHCYSVNVLSRFLKNLSPIPFLAFKAHFIAGDEELFIAVPQ